MTIISNSKNEMWKGYHKKLLSMFTLWMGIHHHGMPRKRSILEIGYIAVLADMQNVAEA